VVVVRVVVATSGVVVIFATHMVVVATCIVSVVDSGVVSGNDKVVVASCIVSVSLEHTLYSERHE
jgi:hypothetical protein